jgi:tetratricopeptide (TPR) repeat protein
MNKPINYNEIETHTFIKNSGNVAPPQAAYDDKKVDYHTQKTTIPTNASTDLAALITLAQTAATALDWPRALKEWKHYNLQYPDQAEGFIGQAEAYRAMQQQDEADHVLMQCMKKNGKITGKFSQPDIAISYALNAQTIENWPEALERWRAARQTFSHVPASWAGEAAMLQILNRTDEAAQIISEAMMLFPDSIDIAAQHCNVALGLKNWLQADLCLNAIEEQFPDHDYTKTTARHIRARITDGLNSLDINRLFTLAQEAETAKAWQTAAKIWRIAHERNPDNPGFLNGLGAALRESKQYDEADRILGRGLQAHPDFIEIYAQHAQVAASRLDWIEAARRWQKTLRQFPDLPILWVMAATSYREAGLNSLAETLLERAITLEPERVDLYIHYALTAERAGDWPKAVARWDKAHRLRPDDQNIQNSRGDAIWQETISKLENSTKTSKETKIICSDSPYHFEIEDTSKTLKQLALGFESLGDNCEFGIVQRRFGADPIGLFRFAAVAANTLTTMIEEEFKHLGDPAFIELGLTAGNEYLVRDTRTPYYMHSFVQKDSVDSEKFMKQQITRIGFLKRKLLEDLTNCEKIFVYKASFGISDAEISSLYDALNRFGKNHLLIVTKSANGITPGSIETLSNRLFLGYVETLYDQDDSPIDFASWQKILKAVKDCNKTDQKPFAGGNLSSTLAGEVR